jgi:hypothetical protein
MTDAATSLLRLLETLDRDGKSVVELVRDGREATPWVLYPGEYGIFDRETRCQCYYHSHDGAPHEDGHFHTVRLFTDHTVHVVAISMARGGWPRALFTLNLWAIGDRDEPAERLKQYARRFRVDEHCGKARVVRFVNLVFAAFLPEIEQLQESKVARLAGHRLAHPDLNPFEDRSLEIVSSLAIDVRQRVTRSVQEVRR